MEARERGILSDPYLRMGYKLARKNYTADWPQLCNWLESNPDPLLRESYRLGRIEHLFTLLDLAVDLQTEGFSTLARKQGIGQGGGPVCVEKPELAFGYAIDYYCIAREYLLRALATFFAHWHEDDLTTIKNADKWTDLRRFASKIFPGDIVITFNYDSSLERVLLECGKWSPKNGYGFQVDLQKSESDTDPAPWGESQIIILHLHGAAGWHNKPFVDFFRSQPNSPIYKKDYERMERAILEEPIALDSAFIRNLGVKAVDSNRVGWTSVELERQILIYPSYLKNIGVGGPSPIFPSLWQKAAEALRRADKIFIIGYSLPSADGASLSLLVTNCRRDTVEIVNNDPVANERLRRLLTTSSRSGPPGSFNEWLDRIPDFNV